MGHFDKVSYFHLWNNTIIDFLKKCEFVPMTTQSLAQPRETNTIMQKVFYPQNLSKVCSKLVAFFDKMLQPTLPSSVPSELDREPPRLIVLWSCSDQWAMISIIVEFSTSQCYRLFNLRHLKRGNIFWQF